MATRQARATSRRWARPNTAGGASRARSRPTWRSVVLDAPLDLLRREPEVPRPEGQLLADAAAEELVVRVLEDVADVSRPAGHVVVAGVQAGRRPAPGPAGAAAAR